MSDLISRQEAIDAIETHAEKIYQNVKKGATYPKKEWFSGMAYACEIIEALPSDDFVEYLLDVISPNEMEMYRKMYEERAKYNG